MNLAESSAGEGDALPPVTLVSGKWVILIVVGLGLFGSVFAWLWQYDAQRRPRDFWGFGAWQRIGLAPHVDALLLQPEPAASQDKPHPIWYDGLLVVPLEPNTADRYIVAERKDVARAPGISLPDQSASLREALRNHRSYQWESKAAQLQKPVWRYALRFADDIAPADANIPPAPGTASSTPTATSSAAPTATPSGTPAPATTSTASPRPLKPPVASPVSPKLATILFDEECRFVRLSSVDKPAVLQPGIAEQFKKFFLTTFPPVK